MADFFNKIGRRPPFTKASYRAAAMGLKAATWHTSVSSVATGDRSDFGRGTEDRANEIAETFRLLFKEPGLFKIAFEGEVS